MDNYPYSDDLMIFSEEENRYYITEQALIQRGIDLRSRLSNATNQEYIIDGIIRDTTDIIYSFIHEHNVDNEFQDDLIAKTPSLRKIIYNALIHQAIYVIKNGNLTLSIDENERKHAIDMIAKSELNRVVPELHNSILYQGRWIKWTC